MRHVEIEIFPIAHTAVNRAEVRRWLDHLNATKYELPPEETVTDPALLIAMAAKRCYLSFEPGLNPNVSQIRSDLTVYLDNILKSGHGSVLEHSTWTFAIEGVSRVFTGEMNRHRAGVGISEASMRYIRYTDIPWWVPPSMRLTNDEELALERAKKAADKMSSRFHSVAPLSLEAVLSLPPADQELVNVAKKKMATFSIFNKHYLATENCYKELQCVWEDELHPSSKFKQKKAITSMMRRIIPMGVATGGVWTMNIRAVRHIMALRASEAAEEEICYVFSRIAKIMVGAEPMLLGDFTEDENGFWRPKYAKV